MANPYHDPDNGQFTFSPSGGVKGSLHAEHAEMAKANVRAAIEHMPASKLQKAIDVVSSQSSLHTDKLISAGYGNVKGQDILKQNNVLADRYRALSMTSMELHDEKNARLMWSGTLKPRKSRV